MTFHHPFGFTFNQERAAGLLGGARELGIVSVIATLLSGIATACATAAPSAIAGISTADMHSPAFPGRAR